MIYITGDTHGQITRFHEAGFKGESNLTKDDYIIVCGDFGFVFYPEDVEKHHIQQRELDELEQKPYTILFVDGNHENFDLLNRFPTEFWNGGRIHRLRRNVIHLMRGQIFTIDGKKIFTMGGAYSRDRYLRTLGRSYWNEELPWNGEYREATQNLREAGNEVDYIITHNAPREIILQMGEHPDVHDEELTGFLEWIMQEVHFKKWFFGHWHSDKEVNDRVRAVYFNVIPLENT